MRRASVLVHVDNVLLGVCAVWTDKVKPVARLELPRHIGICQWAILDASRSINTPNDARCGFTYHFFATSPNASASELARINQVLGANSSQSLVHVTDADMGNALEWQFHLNLTNCVGETTSTFALLSRIRAAVPDLSIASPTLFTYVYEELTIQSSSVPPNCGEPVDWVNVQYRCVCFCREQACLCLSLALWGLSSKISTNKIKCVPARWSQTGGPLLWQPALLANVQSRLHLPAYALKPGETYEFRSVCKLHASRDWRNLQQALVFHSHYSRFSTGCLGHVDGEQSRGESAGAECFRQP